MHPMRTYLFGVAVSALLATPALAQLNPNVSPSARVKVGILMPGGKAKDTIGAQQPGTLVELGGYHAADGSVLSVGYFGGTRQGVTMRTVPILLTKSTPMASPIPGLTGFYSGSGLGAYFIDADGSGAKSRWGGYVSVGFQLAGGITAEAQYHYVNGNVAGYSPKGVAYMLGLKL